MTTTLYAFEAVDAYTANYRHYNETSVPLFGIFDGQKPTYIHEIGSNPISYDGNSGSFNFLSDGIYTFALSGNVEYDNDVNIEISLNSLQLIQIDLDSSTSVIKSNLFFEGSVEVIAGGYLEVI